jgi:phosphoribosylformimino-5-aminoimidazole carboxamide ribotide isomerase
MIIFPAIDVQGGKCVRLRQGNFDEATTYADDPVDAAVRWKEEGGQWLHVVDLDGARLGSSQPSTLAAVTRMAAETGLPIQLGGGVRNANDVARMLDAGAARVVAGTAVSRDASLAAALFASFGDRIAVGVDARDGIVAVEAWLESSGERATVFVRRMADLGAARFIFTDIARDGMLRGVNLASLAEVACCVPNLPVIASGGVASAHDIEALVELKRSSAPNIEGIIIGKALYSGDITLPVALSSAGADQIIGDSHE